MSAALRITDVRIRNVKGAVSVDLRLGDITEATGKNAGGKSSLIDAIHATLRGGNLMDLVHVGPDGLPVLAADGEPDEGQPRLPYVSLTLEGPGAYYVVERSGDDVAVRERVGESAAMRPVPRPAAFLRQLYDGACADPVALLQKKEPELALLLLEALPLRLEPAQLAAALAGVAPSVLPAVPKGLHPLEVIELNRDAIYKARTATNRDALAARGAADQVRLSTPANIPTDPAAAVASATAAVERLAGELERGEEAARGAHALATREATHAADAAAQKIRAGFDAKRLDLHVRRDSAIQTALDAHIRHAAQLRAEAEAAIAADLATVVAANADVFAATEASIEKERAAAAVAMTAADETETAGQRTSDEALAAALAALQPTRDAIVAARSDLAVVQERASLAATARANRDLAADFAAKSVKAAAEAEILTAALGKLDTLRRSLADAIPFPGLVIREKRISLDGVPWSQVNHAGRLKFLVALSAMRAKAPRLPILFVDAAEALDGENYAALKLELARAGVQSLIGRVEDHPFTVTAQAHEELAHASA